MQANSSHVYLPTLNVGDRAVTFNLVKVSLGINLHLKELQEAAWQHCSNNDNSVATALIYNTDDWVDTQNGSGSDRRLAMGHIKPDDVHARVPSHVRKATLLVWLCGPGYADPPEIVIPVGRGHVLLAHGHCEVDVPLLPPKAPPAERLTQTFCCEQQGAMEPQDASAASWQHTTTREPSIASRCQDEARPASKRSKPLYPTVTDRPAHPADLAQLPLPAGHLISLDPSTGIETPPAYNGTAVAHGSSTSTRLQEQEAMSEVAVQPGEPGAGEDLEDSEDSEDSDDEIQW